MVAGVELMAQGARLGQELASRATTYWAATKWIKVNSVGEVLLKHLEGRFIPLKELTSGTLLPNAVAAAERHLWKRFAETYWHVVNAVPQAKNWTANDWMEWLNQSGANVPAGKYQTWLKGVIQPAIPSEKLVAVLSHTSLCENEAKALTIFALCSQPPEHSLTAAERFQASWLETRPSNEVATAALQGFSKGLPTELAGPNGSAYTIDQLRNGTVLPNAQRVSDAASMRSYASNKMFAKFSQAIKELSVRKYSWALESASPAERMQIALISAGMGQSLEVRKLGHTGFVRLLTEQGPGVSHGQIGALADLSPWEKSDLMWELERSKCLGMVCRLGETPEDFRQLVKQIGEDYPGLRTWLESLNRTDVLGKTFWELNDPERGIVLWQMTYVAPHVLQDLIQRTMTGVEVASYLKMITPGA